MSRIFDRSRCLLALFSGPFAWYPARFIPIERRPTMPPILYVDADGCPVKDEIYRVAARHGIAVKLVANSGLRVPESGDVELILVDDGFDAADDWIVEHAQANDVVVTTDIPLAARCVEKNARVLSPTGRVFTEDTIGGAL